MRVVVDTNVFISSLLTRGGNPRKVIDLWRLEKITLCLSREILGEYFAVLGRLGMTQEPEGGELIALFQKRYNQIFLASVPAISVISEDPADNKFIECAVAADAKYVISGDQHLLNLGMFRGIRMVSPKDFLKVKA
ncbi:MAG: putative toxin-antitoxin system toxin component, PIN family [Spirochaetia bacterium]